MTTYPTQTFTVGDSKVELRPNREFPRRFTDLYVNGELQGIYEAKKASQLAKQIAALLKK